MTARASGPASKGTLSASSSAPVAGEAGTELDFARSVLREEAEAVVMAAEGLDGAFVRAVDVIASCATSGGTVLVSGLGKSGLIGAKISATLASLGIPSHSVHPAEAAHGDLGRFRPNDVAVAISFSGETLEVVNLAAILRQDGLGIIAIVGRAARASSLASLATVTLALPVEREAAAPAFVAPTCSTTATLAVGDALALAVARRRGFSDDDFAKRHPGGSLGSMLRPVVDVLRFRVGVNVVPVPTGTTVTSAMAMADTVARRPGAILIVDSSGALAGIVTDSDLRRAVLRDRGSLDRPIDAIMTRTPRTIVDSAMVRDALVLIREHRQDEIPVIDARGRPVGLLDVQDLVALRLVCD